MARPLTVGMTTAFYLPGDMLLRAQLRCLSEQSEKDFDVLVADHHYEKRKGYMPELAEKYKLNIVHVPYRPATHVAKKLDCAAFNAPYCFSESPRIVRYSCWRFVRPDFTKICLESSTNVDFRFHSCEPKNRKPQFRDDNSATDHDMEIWDMKSDFVNWNAIPKKSGEPGASWGPDADSDAPAELFYKNCYGNYMVFRDQWLNVNGTDETWSSLAHYEDIFFCVTARNNKMVCKRVAHKLYRLHHFYGQHSGRANISPDVEFTKPCAQCEAASNVLEPKRFNIKARVAVGEIELLESKGVWVCKTCFLCGPIYHTGCHEHVEHHLERNRMT